MESIHQLIRDYSTAVGEAFDDLLATYPLYRMIPRDLQIPQRGTLPSGRTYTFHGIGCRFKNHGIIVDMDFGIVKGELRADGFDAWRLQVFANSVGPDNVTVEEIQLGLDRLNKAGEIMKTDNTASSLYFPVRLRAE